MARRRPIPDAPPESPVAHVHDLDQDGRGVACVGGKVVFVEGALAGEEVLLRYTRRRGRFDEAVAEEILTPSQERVEPRCAYFARCGGCNLQHLQPAAQVRLREARLLESLHRLGGVEPAAVLPPVTGGSWGYRRRARLGVRHVPGKGGVLVGFREKRSSKVAELEACEVLDPVVGRRLAALRVLVGGLEARRRIPQIEVAVGDERAALVIRHLDPLGDGDRDALRRFGREQNLDLWLQAGSPDELEPLWPERPAPLRYRLPEFDLVFRFRPTDFVQVNAAVNRVLVALAVELLAPAPGGRVLDLYCGIGNFTLPLARRAGTVTGVEGDAGLVKRARENAAANGIGNAEFQTADLSGPGVAGLLSEGWDAVFLDPPRSGALEVVQALTPPLPARVVYVSCNPATLARDAGVLVRERGYRLERAGVVDMFPHTGHSEAVALFAAA